MGSFMPAVIKVCIKLNGTSMTIFPGSHRKCTIIDLNILLVSQGIWKLQVFETLASSGEAIYKI